MGSCQRVIAPKTVALGAAIRNNAPTAAKFRLGWNRDLRGLEQARGLRLRFGIPSEMPGEIGKQSGGPALVPTAVFQNSLRRKLPDREKCLVQRQSQRADGDWNH